MTKLTYLCGGIAGLSDSACNDWRQYAKEHLKTFCLDPMVRDCRGREESVNPHWLVTSDLRDIQESNFVLVNATKPSWGTAMEVVYAFNKNTHTPIIAFVGDSVPSPWLVFHCDHVVKTLDEAIGVINAKL